MFFQTKPNLPDAEKAKVEFHLQQIAECIGFERFLLPVQSCQAILAHCEASEPIESLVSFVGKHLSHDVTGLHVTVTPEALQKCGGGG